MFALNTRCAVSSTAVCDSLFRAVACCATPAHECSASGFTDRRAISFLFLLDFAGAIRRLRCFIVAGAAAAFPQAALPSLFFASADVSRCARSSVIVGAPRTPPQQNIFAVDFTIRLATTLAAIRVLRKFRARRFRVAFRPLILISLRTLRRRQRRRHLPLCDSRFGVRFTSDYFAPTTLPSATQPTSLFLLPMPRSRFMFTRQQICRDDTRKMFAAFFIIDTPQRALRLAAPTLAPVSRASPFFASFSAASLIFPIRAVRCYHDVAARFGAQFHDSRRCVY